LDFKKKYMIATGIAIPLLAIIVPASLTLTTGGGPAPVDITVSGGTVIVGTISQYNGISPAPTASSHADNTNSACSTPAQGVGGSSAVAVDLYVRASHEGQCWSRGVGVTRVPATVEYMIVYVNSSNATQKNVVIGIKLPKGMAYVSGSTMVANSSAPQGQLVNVDAIDTSGIEIGTYAPKANAFIAFDAEILGPSDIRCGQNLLKTTATVQPAGLNYFWNTADVRAENVCPTS
jgi:uncharacterized repeat protein (TIGR01451 family)